jgi:hypothetical protein
MSFRILIASLIILPFFAAYESISNAQVHTAKSFDFSGVDQFWKMVETFERDVEPTEEQWGSLLETPGYNYLIKVEGKEKLFKRYLPIVFRPSKKAELTRVLANGGDDLRYVTHYLNVKARREELIQFQKRLQNRPLMNLALQRTSRYLPDGVVTKYPPPTVFFAIFEADGKATDSFIVVDLLFARNVGVLAFIAHESHHYYVERISKLKTPEREAKDYYLIHAVDQLRLEGVADLIDKPGMLREVASHAKDQWLRWYASEYKKQYLRSNRILEQIDNLIADMSVNPDKLEENSKRVWDLLPFAGHPTGYYMARAIVEDLGKDAVIKNIGNPFAFLRQFNRAAKMRTTKRKHHILSDRTIDYLNILEGKYITK